MHSDSSAWLGLAASKGFSPRLIKQLYQAFGSTERLFCASDRELEANGLTLAKRRQLRALTQAAPACIAPVARWLQADPNHHLISLSDPLYPPQLLAIDDPPPLLYLHGDPELLRFPQIALVGSRRASVQGSRDARTFAKALSLAGLIPTSGLALGIDTCAHEGALAGQGLTVAVLGSGIDQLYPARNRGLAQQIVQQGGVLMSEFPLGTPPLPAFFPRRNRVISGLSMGVLVVEAALQSGSLITARLAAEQGREVFALPGSIHNPASRGCHQLIRQGATLVTCCDDIVAELAPALVVPVAADLAPAEVRAAASCPDTALILQQCGYDPTPLDAIVARCGLSVAQVQSLLIALELEGQVVAVSGGYQRC